jgi:hypothetical protein
MDHDAPPPLTLAAMQAALLEAEQQANAGETVPASEVHAMLQRGIEALEADAVAQR